MYFFLIYSFFFNCLNINNENIYLLNLSQNIFNLIIIKKIDDKIRYEIPASRFLKFTTKNVPMIVISFIHI